MAGRTDDYDRRDELDHYRADVVPADTATIRAEIRETRDRMSHTLDGIGDRLNPDHIKQQVKDNLREATIGRAETMARHAADRVDETRRGIRDTLRDNPIPAAMVGIGLGWLLFNGKREERDVYERDMGYWTGYDDRSRYAATDRPRGGGYERPDALGSSMDRAGATAGSMASRAQGAASALSDRAHDLADDAQETVSDFADRTRDTASRMADRATDAIEDQAMRAKAKAQSLARQTRYQTHRIEDRVHDAVVDSPLVVGAAAVALGLTAGLAIPSTRRESELMGETRDRLFERARDAAEETGEKVQNVAQQVAERVTDEAQTAAREAAKEEGLVSGEHDRSGRSPSTGGMSSPGAGDTGTRGTSTGGAFGGGGASTGSGTGGSGAFGSGGTGTGSTGTGSPDPKRRR